MEKTSFTSKNIEDPHHKFERLLSKFLITVDPIERFIKRQEMIKVKEILEEKYGEHVEIP